MAKQSCSKAISGSTPDTPNLTRKTIPLNKSLPRLVPPLEDKRDYILIGAYPIDDYWKGMIRDYEDSRAKEEAIRARTSSNNSGRTRSRKKKQDRRS